MCCQEVLIEKIKRPVSWCSHIVFFFLLSLFGFFFCFRSQPVIVKHLSLSWFVISTAMIFYWLHRSECFS